MKKYQIATDDIYILSIEPCYDKKMESNRSAFSGCDPKKEVQDYDKEIDCVLSTEELLKEIEEKKALKTLFIKLNLLHKK